MMKSYIELRLIILVLIASAISIVSSSDPGLGVEEIRARVYLENLDKKSGERATKSRIVRWAYLSNITDANLQIKLHVSSVMAKEIKDDWLETIKFNWQSFQDYDLRRQFWKYSTLGTSALSHDKHRENEKIITEMQKVHSMAKICKFGDEKKCDLSLEPEISEILAKSRNESELKHIWVQWRDAVGPKVKHLYRDYVDLQNEAAKLNNFTDNTEAWLDNYESSDFRDQIQQLWEQMRPLYLQIHAYVRHQLRGKYGDEVVSEKGPIPAHLLGNMWAQSWVHISDDTLPYPGKSSVDATVEMVKQNYTALKIFQIADDFFVSLNLTAVPKSFWNKSILEKPVGRELVCHASAWDFYDGEDFRVKQCTNINEQDFFTAHHEMGHVQYFLQYKDQPYIFRGGANDGFHEAVGDVIALSVGTPTHLRKIGLLKDTSKDEHSALNNLFRVGLDKIVFLPFAYLMDLWRWDVFSGKTTYNNYNCKWWQLRHEYQGIEPPVDRSEEDFDAASKHHIVADVPYIRYFISFVIQFQFHRSLCEKAGQYIPNDPTKPLHECDIYQSVEAGNALGKMLQLGSSRPWPDAMEIITGQRNMDASGLLEYFHPLQKWLEMENLKNGVHVGWEPTKKVCSKTKHKKDQQPT